MEKHRKDSSGKQRVIANLGHADELSFSGKLDDLVRSMLKHTTAVWVIDAHRGGSTRAHCTKSLGPALVFDKLWRDLRILEVI